MNQATAYTGVGSVDACRSGECYDVITYKVIPYKCSWCDGAFVNSYGEETVSMQNRNILENYYTRRV